MNFSDKMTILRKHNNLTQQQLATKLNVSRQAVQKWESGDSLPDINKLPLLSKEFQISVDDLLDNHISQEDLQKKLLGVEPQEDFVELAKKATFTDWFLVSSIVLGTSIYIGLLHIVGVILFLSTVAGTVGIIAAGLYSFINMFYNLQNGLPSILVHVGFSLISIPLGIMLFETQRSILRAYREFLEKVMDRIKSYLQRRGVRHYEK